MPFVREKTKGISSYYELVESIRSGGKVRQRVINYFGSRKEMEDYCKTKGIPVPQRNAGLLGAPLCARLKGKLDELNSLRPLPKNAVDSLRRKFDVEMTYNSNAIEGNRLSLRETYFLLEKGMTIGGKPMKDYLEATNHRDAIRLLEKITDSRRKITEMDILNLHAAILGQD